MRRNVTVWLVRLCAVLTLVGCGWVYVDRWRMAASFFGLALLVADVIFVRELVR